jgi:transcription-repair coupling factor (superfamily II helicase)
VKVRLRALAVRALDAGPGRLVLTLGEGAALDPFLLAKQVQGSQGRLRLTPDMKLVAALGPPPARPVGAARAGAPEDLLGRELLQAAKELLAELARCARQG